MALLKAYRNRKAFPIQSCLTGARCYYDAHSTVHYRDYTGTGICDRLGYYEPYINGKRVGNHVLAPAKTNYRRRVLYDPYDVTKMIKPGINASMHSFTKPCRHSRG